MSYHYTMSPDDPRYADMSAKVQAVDATLAILADALISMGDGDAYASAIINAYVKVLAVILDQAKRDVVHADTLTRAKELRALIDQQSPGAFTVQ